MNKELNGLKQKIYFISDVEKIIGRNRQTIKRWWKKGFFPKPISIGNHFGWDESVVQRWVTTIFFVEQKEKNS